MPGCRRWVMLPAIMCGSAEGQAMRLTGKRGLVVGVANERSIAAGCARVVAAEGARLAITLTHIDAGRHVRM